MNNKEMNLAIAEARGWQPGWWCPECQERVEVRSIDDDRCHGLTGGCGAYVEELNPPDCAGDLNEMAEAEKQLLDSEIVDKRSLYYDFLVCVLGAERGFEMDWKLLRASAAQRAEAILRTFGKWR